MFDSLESVEKFADRFILWLLIKYSSVFRKNISDLLDYPDEYKIYKNIEIISQIISETDEELNKEWNNLFTADEIQPTPINSEEEDKLFSDKIKLFAKEQEQPTLQDLAWKRLLFLLEFIFTWKTAWINNLLNQKYPKDLIYLIAKVGYTPGFKEILTILKTTDTLDILLTIDESRYTPLHWAVKNEKLEIIHCCVENSIEVNIWNRDGLTPLMLAVKNDIPEIIYGFAKNSNLANFVSQDVLGKKLLYYAVRDGAINFINFLLIKKLIFSSVIDDDSLLRAAVESKKLSMVKIIFSQYPNPRGYNIVNCALKEIAKLTHQGEKIPKDKLDTLKELDQIIKFLLATKKIKLSSFEVKDLKKYIDKGIISADDTTLAKIFAHKRWEKKYNAIIGGFLCFFGCLVIIGAVALLGGNIYSPLILSIIGGGTAISGVLLVLLTIAFCTPIDKAMQYFAKVQNFFAIFNARIPGRAVYEFSADLTAENTEVENSTSQIHKSLSSKESSSEQESEKKSDVSKILMNMPEETTKAEIIMDIPEGKTEESDSENLEKPSDSDSASRPTTF